MNRISVWIAVGAALLPACGGMVDEDHAPESTTGGTTTATAGATSTVAPILTCGAWLDAVRETAQERCGWAGVQFLGYDEERVMDAELAASVCLPALAAADCAVPDPDFIPDACEIACAQ